MAMRTLILAALAAAALAYGGTAFAQSHQGGPLGLNPGGNLAATSVPPPPDIGSRQGGALGRNVGADLKPARAPEGDMRESATAWCMSASEPYRCRSHDQAEHAYCVSKDPQHYASCRFALDQMWGH